MRGEDLRLAPAAGACWALAVIGILGGASAAIAVAAGLTALGLTAALLCWPGAAARALLAHAALTILICALLAPSLLRHDATAAPLRAAADAGRTVELSLRVVTEPEPPSSGPAWARTGMQMRARTLPGEARLGAQYLRLPGSAPLLVRIAGEPAAADGSRTAADGERTAADDVHMGESVRVRGTLRRSGDLLVLTTARLHPQRAGAAAGLSLRLRSQAREGLQAATASLPADEGALVRGMTDGDTRGLSQEAGEIMRRAGITHLVAVSGGNIAFVLGSVLCTLLLIGVRRRPRILLAAAVTGGYVFLVGEEPSALRAATMAAPLLIARFAGVRASAVAALCLTVALWSVADPVTAASPGFLLSALATGAILIGAPPAARALHELSGERIGQRTALVLTVPLLAQLVCTPILILLTPEISIWAVLVNILVGPLIGPVTILGLLAVALAPLWPAAAVVLCALAGGGAHLVLLIAAFFDSLPGSQVAVPEGPRGAALGVGVIVLVAVMIAGRRSRLMRWAMVAVVVAGGGAVTGRTAPLSGASAWQAAMCSVGQGDAVLLRGQGAASQAATVLIDTGPEPAVLRECLDRLGVARIDLLVLTHPHADHTGGRSALTGGRAPAAQWVCPLPEAMGQRVPVAGSGTVAASTGTAWRRDGLELEILWPPSAEAARSAAVREDGSGEGDAANDCSLVLSATWADGTRMVALGDLEPIAQRELADLAPGHADIVKVAHHGSRRQHAPLYEQLRPTLALVPVGQKNSFGHPTPHALGMLAGLGAQVVRTDQHGTVILPAGEERRPYSVGPPL